MLLSVIVALAKQGQFSLGSTAQILLSAIGFLAVVVIVGSYVSTYISRFVLSLRANGAALSIALTLGILAGGIAEHYFGLAMIIGAYSVGLALSSTKLKERVERQVHSVSLFLTPLFFVVIGMQVDFRAFASSDASLVMLILFAVLLSVFGVISKIGGSGLPALALGFNRLGAMRVGTGMMPRGEVALIVAGIGIAEAIIDQTIFTIVVVMTVVTTVIAPPLLLYLFRRPGSGMRDDSDTLPPDAQVGSS